jgi:hypothetical protein
MYGSPNLRKPSFLNFILSTDCKETNNLFFSLSDFINNRIGAFEESQIPGYKAMDKEHFSNLADWDEEEDEWRSNTMVCDSFCFSLKNKEHVEQAIKTLQLYLDDPELNGADCLIYIKEPAL